MHLSSAIDRGHSSTSRIAGSHPTIHNSDLPEGFKNVEVQAMTLDDFVTKEKVLPDILKVDIEGAEYEFLLGAVETIRNTHPTFYIEFHSPYCATKCTELLVLEGYSTRVIHEEEDNRVMVRAAYTHSKSGTGVDIEKMRALNNEFLMLKAMTDSLAILNAELQIKVHRNAELLKENDTLKLEQKKVDELESTNRSLAKRVKDLESSWSWNLTRPLRKTRLLLSKLSRSAWQ
jgi:hypothetical protein